MKYSAEELLLRERLENLIWVQNFLLDVLIEFEEAHEDNNISGLLCEELLLELALRRKATNGLNTDDN